MYIRFSGEEKLFISGFNEYDRKTILAFLKDCSAEDPEVEKFKDQLLIKVEKMTDDEFLKEMNTI